MVIYSTGTCIIYLSRFNKKCRDRCHLKFLKLCTISINFIIGLMLGYKKCKKMFIELKNPWCLWPSCIKKSTYKRADEDENDKRPCKEETICIENDVDENSRKKRDMWILFNSLYASLCCISSHLGYILVAWLTEPDKTTSTALIAFMVVLYFFLCFRKLYDIFNHCCSSSKGTENSDYDDLDPENNDTFNYIAFAAELIFLVIFPIPVIIVMLAFSSIPIPVIELANYLKDIVQILLVLLASLISYRILSLKDSDMVRFLKKMVKNYSKKEEDKAISEESRQNTPSEGNNQDTATNPATNPAVSLSVQEEEDRQSMTPGYQNNSATTPAVKESGHQNNIHAEEDEFETAGNIVGHVLKVVVKKYEIKQE